MNREPFKLYMLLKNLSSCCQDSENLQAKAFGVSVPELRCLIAIKLEECETTTELADKMCLAKSRITRIIDGLVSKGYIIRREDPDDRRVLKVRLTHSGRALTEKISKSLLVLHNMVLQNFDYDERKNMLERLSALTAAMKTVRDNIEKSAIES